DARVQLDVPTQVKLVRDIIEVALVLRLARIMFFPVPFLQEFFREGIAVGVTLRVEARARVAIPIPGAAYATPRLVDPHREPALPQTVQLVQPGHAGADNNRVKLLHVLTPVWSACRRPRSGMSHSTILPHRCTSLVVMTRPSPLLSRPLPRTSAPWS